MTGSWRSWSGSFGSIRNLRDPLLPGNRLRRITATDAEIDALVSDFYSLTAEKIRILGQSGRKTECVCSP
jgi:hypothetical protein